MSKPVSLKSIAGVGRAGNYSAANIMISGLTADSREVEPGTLFAALLGTETDGVRYIPDAIARGAAAILVSAERAAEVPAEAPVITDPEPRRRLALMASRFYAGQPECTVAITGTNGKTSVASFVRQIWQAQGLNAASLGTVGLVTAKDHENIAHTTPDPVFLHKMLSRISRDGVTHLALETSSHGLAQYRVDGVAFAAGAFTNISRDHLDYHRDFDDYFAQKARLFSVLLPNDAAVVVDMDSEGARRIAQIAAERELSLLSVGRSGDGLKLLESRMQGFRQTLTVRWGGSDFTIDLPLVGGFQASNAMIAAGICLATGSHPDLVFQSLSQLKGADGRLEYVGKTGLGAPIFVDYAHTPGALTEVLGALRPHASGRLIVVFGCGGDRDPGKRAVMGQVAAEKADRVVVTDDNPRTEEPAAIRSAILAACPGGIEIGDRGQAIRAAVAELRAGDLLLVAGKGHETGQIVGDRILPFDDRAEVKAALAELSGAAA